MKKKMLCLLVVLAVCAGIGYGASQPMFRRVYTNNPSKSANGNPKVTYYMDVQRDTETGVDYIILTDSKGNPVSITPRLDADGKLYVTSKLTTN